MGVDYSAVVGFGLLACDLPEEHQESKDVEWGEAGPDGICRDLMSHYGDNEPDNVFVGFVLSSADQDFGSKEIDPKDVSPEALAKMGAVFERRFGVSPKLLSYVHVW